MRNTFGTRPDKLADDEDDVLPYAREQDLIVVTSDVTDFGTLSSEDHACVILLHVGGRAVVFVRLNAATSRGISIL